MLRYVLSLRLIILVGSLGAMFGALLMFWLGGTHIVVAIQGLVTANDPKLIIGSVMSATDAFLFGIVLSDLPSMCHQKHTRSCLRGCESTE